MKCVVYVCVCVCVCVVTVTVKCSAMCSVQPQTLD